MQQQFVNNMQQSPLVCFYCNKPNHKAADCFYKFKDERKQLKLSSVGYVQGTLHHNGPTGGVSPRLTSNFTKPIRPLHTTSRMGMKFYKPATPHHSSLRVHPYQHVQHGHQAQQQKFIKRNPYLHPSHDIPEPLEAEFHEQGSVSHHPSQAMCPDSECRSEYSENHENFENKPLDCGSTSVSEEHGGENFVNALFYMAQERKRLGKNLFRGMPCATPIGEKIHKALVECEENLNNL